MKTGLRDRNKNDIYVGDKIRNNSNSYFVRFGYHSIDDSRPAYGFYLECLEYGNFYNIPYAPTKILKLEKLNILQMVIKKW